MNRFNRPSFNSPSATKAVTMRYDDLLWRNIVIGALLTLVLLLLFHGNVNSQTRQGKSSARWWSDAAESALVQAGTNRPELVKALNEANPGQRQGMQFLIENMPEQDLKSLTATFLRDNLTMAYKGWQEAPWGITIPTDIFLNDILPYASVTEPRG